MRAVDLLKMLVAFVGAVIVVFVISIVGDVLYTKNTTDVPAYRQDLLDLPEPKKAEEEMIEEAEEQTADAKETMEEAVEEVVEEAKEAMTEAAEGAEQAMTEAAESAGEAAEGAGNAVSDAAQDLVDTMKESVEEAGAILSADAAKGATLFKRQCGSCHTINDGGPNRVGPNLYAVMGRDIASVSGFRYSSGMEALEGVWEQENMTALLTNPKDLVKGTRMTFRGFKKPQDIADVIAYLRENQ